MNGDKMKVLGKSRMQTIVDSPVSCRLTVAPSLASLVQKCSSSRSANGLEVTVQRAR